VILCFRDLLQDALSDRLEERIPFLTSSIKVTIRASSSVMDPDPQDPNVFGPPGSGSISQR
jgi:hypothetical protein